MPSLDLFKRVATIPGLIVFLTLAIFPCFGFSQPTDGTPSEEEQKLLADVDAIGNSVATLRGLPILEPIQRGVQKREQLRDRIISMLKAEVTPDDIRAEGELLKRLEFIPKSVDYYDLILDMLTSQIAGFYDPAIRKLYVMTGLPEEMQRTTIAHEIFHAIQDQHYKIRDFQRPFDSKRETDLSLARSALLEGDATIVMIDFNLQEGNILPGSSGLSFIDQPVLAPFLYDIPINQLLAMNDLMPTSSVPELGEMNAALEKMPDALQKILLFPYLGGLRFIAHIRALTTKNGAPSWGPINNIYLDPPTSTEQILHPKKYLEKDQPIGVSFNAEPFLTGYTSIYQAVLGEFQTMLYLEAHLPDWAPEGISLLPTSTPSSTNSTHTTKTPIQDGSPENKTTQGNTTETKVPPVTLVEAAAGWGGDQVQILKNGDHTILIQLSTWDTIKDAKEYNESIHELLKRRKGTTTADEKKGNGSLYVISKTDETALVERWGDMVLFIDGLKSSTPYETICKVRDGIWATHKRISFERLKKEAEKVYVAPVDTPSTHPTAS